MRVGDKVIDRSGGSVSVIVGFSEDGTWAELRTLRSDGKICTCFVGGAAIEYLTVVGDNVVPIKNLEYEMLGPCECNGEEEEEGGDLIGR